VRREMSGPKVVTEAGPIQGVVREGVTQFLGVPFATPTLGARRFLAPAPLKPWAGVRRAESPRTSPPQLPSPSLLHTQDQLPSSEDCLELNVYTPAIDSGARPVMVWYYGGGFTIGSAGTYDATSLAERGDVVVVTVNYRLGALGFSFLEHLDERFAGSANAGIRDQIAALRWVRDNIVAFGGDPDCVTIFGQSAGGHSVGCLLTSPEAQGLFHRCILQSSAGWGLRTQDWAEKVTANLMSELGRTTVEQLQKDDVDVLLAAQATLPMRKPEIDPGLGGPRTMGVAAFPFAPTCDGVVLNGAVIDQVAAGRAATVPLLICHTHDELKLFVAMGVLADLPDEAHDLAQRMARTLPDGQRAVEAYRSAEPDGSPADWYVSFLTDQTYHMPDFRLADVRLPHDPRVWIARFSWESSADGGAFGACHGIEIPFLFRRPGRSGGFLGDQEAPVEIAHTMQDAWAAFARSGDPNCDRLPTWPPYETGQRAVMSFNTESRVFYDPDGAVRTMWESIEF
jgi:para-nitrobenzyl esterase